MKKTWLTSRERVLRAIHHQPGDRVPFNLSLTVDVHHRLREHLGLPPEPEKKIGLWTEVSAGIDLLDAMHVDIYTIGLNPPVNWTPTEREDGLIYDEWGVGRKRISRSDGSYYFEMVKHPLAEATTVADILDYPWPDPSDPGRYEGLPEKVENIRRDTDKAIMVKFSNSIWEQSWWLRGLECWMMDLILQPELCTAIMDRVCDVAVGTAVRALEIVGNQVDIYRLSGEDLGTQLGPMISFDLYNKVVRPRFIRLWTAVKSTLRKHNPDGKLMLHSCGNVRPFIPDWIEMGLNILDPIQPRAKDMQPEELKRDFGKRIAFHGGVDLQHTLPFGTAEEVMKEVYRYIRALAPNGGYIVAPAHNVQSDVPPENLIAIRDAIESYGYFPIQ